MFLTSFGGVESYRANRTFPSYLAGEDNLQRDSDGLVDEPEFHNQKDVSSIVYHCSEESRFLYWLLRFLYLDFDYSFEHSV
jgi:hypothetical protein